MAQELRRMKIAEDYPYSKGLRGCSVTIVTHIRWNVVRVLVNNMTILINTSWLEEIPPD